jgi:hypothetical protein
MSNSSRTDRLPALDLQKAVPSAPALRRPLTGAAFWGAIALPFLYLPLLASGLESETSLTAFLVLVGLNVLMLMVGHSYRGY